MSDPERFRRGDPVRRWPSRTLRRRLAARIALASLAALTALACSLVEREGPQPEGWVEIRGHRVAVEIAEERAEQAKGLGERDSLPWGHGMYFVYDQPGFYSFWMKGMRFAIDIVWLRDGRIVDLHTNVPFEPGGNGPTVRPSSLVNAVLEVPAGYAVAQGWRIGDRVVFERVTATPR
jgi:uncharacterized membrane protein (UPF0127 family)